MEAVGIVLGVVVIVWGILVIGNAYDKGLADMGKRE